MTPRKRLPTRREGIRFAVAGAHVSTGEYPDGRLGEIFISYRRDGAASGRHLALIAARA